jgi:hypothetical protein
VFTAEKLQEVVSLIKPPFTALFLYGSHARGDAKDTSDVDILQVTPVHTAPYTIRSFNITCYTFEQLMRLAGRGGLFARHLVEEAVPLDDPHDILGALKSAYVATQTYDGVRKEVCGCAPLLDVAECKFNENIEGLSSLASYLIRTYLYALAFERGARSFAMDHILGLLGQKRAGVVLSSLKDHNFSAFVAARKLFEELTGVTCLCMEGSLEAFIVNASAHNELAGILGLRLLARGRPFTYDALKDLEL